MENAGNTQPVKQHLWIEKHTCQFEYILPELKKREHKFLSSYREIGGGMDRRKGIIPMERLFFYLEHSENRHKAVQI